MRALVRFLWRSPLLLLLTGLLLLGYTSYKLHRMARIRGWIAGAEEVEKRITDRRRDVTPRGQYAFWLAWDGGRVEVPGPHRINVVESVWEATQVGDTIRGVFEDGDPYLRDGIYVSQGNFVFDGCLLAGEIALCVVAGVRLARRRSATRGAT